MIVLCLPSQHCGHRRQHQAGLAPFEQGIPETFQAQPVSRERDRLNSVMIPAWQEHTLNVRTGVDISLESVRLWGTGPGGIENGGTLNVFRRATRATPRQRLMQRRLPQRKRLI
jgi:hypothetical protein